jgi:hypothetical protein
MSVVMFLLCATVNVAPTKDAILIGQAVSFSGPNAIIHGSGALPTQTLWVEKVNGKRAIYKKGVW